MAKCGCSNTKNKSTKIPSTTPSSPEIEKECQVYVLKDEQLKKIMQLLLEDIKMGLGKSTNSKAIVKCFPTYVQDLPDGTETGKTLALDLGGTNFRVLYINLGNNKENKTKSLSMPAEVLVGTSQQLFDYIAKCMSEFIKENSLQKDVLPVGFCFSFPVNQTSLTTGVLERWTKGFNVSGVVGKDVVKLLEDAIARRGDIKIKICAILNDTTGTLISCAFVDKMCRIGLIIGTGTNACYVEKQKNAELFTDRDKGSGKVIINTEWGAFGDDGKLDFVRTEYDKQIDKDSINPGKQIHEKMISGMYMGELVRLLLVKLTNKGLLFGGKASNLLTTKSQVTAKNVTDIESDPEGTYTASRKFLDTLKLDKITDDDCKNVRYVCECVSRRAAHLISAGLATLLNKMEEPQATVGIDGTVYRLHPHIHNLMMEKMRTLVKPNLKFKLMLSEDGSGRGAAVVGAVASKSISL